MTKEKPAPLTADLMATKGTDEAVPTDGVQRSAAVGTSNATLSVSVEREPRPTSSHTISEAVVDAALRDRYGIGTDAANQDGTARTQADAVIDSDLEARWADLEAATEAAKPGGEAPDGGTARPPPSGKPKKRPRGDDPDGKPDDRVEIGTRIRRDLKERIDLYALLTHRKLPRLIADALEALIEAERDEVPEHVGRAMDAAG